MVRRINSHSEDGLKIQAGKPATLIQGQKHCKVIYFFSHRLSLEYTRTTLQACSRRGLELSAPATSAQDLASFMPVERYLIPVSDALVALKCHSALATAVLSRCCSATALHGCGFLPLCSATWRFRSEVGLGFSPARCFQAGS